MTDHVAFGQIGRYGGSQFDANAALGAAGLEVRTGQLERIASFGEKAGGTAWMVADPRWVVWTQANSATNLGDWTLVAWDQQTRTRTELDTSRGPDGEFAFGPPPLPALRDGVVAWAHYLPRSGTAPEAEIRVLDFATREPRAIARGTISSPVFAGRYLLWAQQAADGAFAITGVDAKTYTPAVLPHELSSVGPVNYLAGAQRALAWTSFDGSSMTVWDLETSELTQYRTVSDLRHVFQFVQLRWPYAVWFGTVTHTVLDLRTGSAFDVDGTIGLGQRLIVRSDRFGDASSRISLAELDDLPPIRSCQPSR